MLDMAKTRYVPKVTIHDWTADEKALHSRSNDLKSLRYALRVAQAQALEKRTDKESLKEIPRYPQAQAIAEKLQVKVEQAEKDIVELELRISAN